MDEKKTVEIAADDPRLLLDPVAIKASVSSLEKAIFDAMKRRPAKCEVGNVNRIANPISGITAKFNALLNKHNLTYKKSEEKRVEAEQAKTAQEQLTEELLGKQLELKDKLDMIEKQSQAIKDLSTPVLQIWDQVLALPIIGLVDTKRSAEIMHRLLKEITSQRARYVILDITGVEVVDTRTADYFIKIVKAAALMGAQCVLTGVQPAVAQTLVEIGVDLGTIDTHGNMMEGLRRCLELKAARKKVSQDKKEEE